MLAPSSGLGSLPRQPVGVLSPTLGRLGQEHSGRKLRWAQRYHFLSGWLPWISDGLALIITMFALVWTVLMTIAPLHVALQWLQTNKSLLTTY